MPVRHRRSNRRRAQSRVVNQPPTARPVTRLALPTSPPHRRTPKLLATRPSFVTRYRPPAPTHCTHPSPINRRNNRLKFFPLAPNGSSPTFPLRTVPRNTLRYRHHLNPNPRPTTLVGIRYSRFRYDLLNRFRYGFRYSRSPR